MRRHPALRGVTLQRITFVLMFVSSSAFADDETIVVIGKAPDREAVRVRDRALGDAPFVTVQTGVVMTKSLGSPPSSVGVLPGIATAFAAQRHPLGRITFVDVTTDAVRTVTGFDLNSHVVN